MLLYYGWLLFVESYSQLTVNHYGRAYSGVIRLAFGQTPFLKQYAVYEGAGKEIIERECSNRVQNGGSSCPNIATDYAGIYYRECAWWRLQTCATVMVEPLFLKHPPMMQALETIVRDPCRFLPSESDIRVAGNAERENPMGRFVEVNAYSHDRKNLGCDKSKTRSMKVILGFRNSDHVEIFRTEIGG